MANFYVFYPPSGGGSSNASVGTNGVTAPTSSTEVGFIDGSGDLQGVSATNPLPVTITSEPGAPFHVIVDSSALPTGAATQTTLATVSTTLGSILLDLTNGTQVTQVTGTVPLPTGASTSALQSNVQSAPGTPQTIALTVQGNASGVPIPVSGTVTANNASIGATGSAVPADTTYIGMNVSGTNTGLTGTGNNLNVNIAAATTLQVTAGQTNAALLKATVIGDSAAGSGDSTGLVTVQGNASGTPIPTSVASLPLPTGASTSALQTTISGQLPATLGQKASAASLAVVIASDQSAIAVTQATAANLKASVNLNDGSGSAVNKGQTTSAGSLPVVLASDQSSIPVVQGAFTASNAPVQNVYSSTNITTAAYTQLIASTTSATKFIDIFDSSGQAMILATGAAASEVILAYIPPGGDSFSFAIPAGTRVAYKALTATANSGYLLLNLRG